MQKPSKTNQSCFASLSMELFDGIRKLWRTADWSRPSLHDSHCGFLFNTYHQILGPSLTEMSLSLNWWDHLKTSWNLLLPLHIFTLHTFLIIFLVSFGCFGFLWFLLSSPHFVHGGSGHPKCEPPVDGLVDFSVGIGHFGTFDDVQHLLTSMDSMVMQGAWWTRQQFVDAPNSISELFDSFGFWCLGWNIPNWSEPWRGIHLTHLSHLYAHFGQWCWDAQDSNCHHFQPQHASANKTYRLGTPKSL